MAKLEEKVSKAIREFEAGWSQSKHVKRYNSADQSFKKLIKKGVAKHRGNRLASNSDVHLRRVKFNSPQ